MSLCRVVFDRLTCPLGSKQHPPLCHCNKLKVKHYKAVILVAPRTESPADTGSNTFKRIYILLLFIFLLLVYMQYGI